MNQMQWSTRDIPDLTGKVALITGANSGLGYETALAMALKGATVVLACRNTQKGNIAYNNIKLQHPKADAHFIKLDLAKLRSVHRFVEQFRAQYDRLDILVNNAGVMGTAEQRTFDGFEYQIGVNFLGHFALTGLLWDRLVATPEARVVHLASLIAERGQLWLDNLMLDRQYRPMRAYAQSKLAMLVFGLEMQRRLTEAGITQVQSIAAHPGISKTNLFEQLQAPRWLVQLALSFMGHRLQSAAQGALPQLYAATAPQAKGGQYIGPDGPRGWKGYPTAVAIPASAQNEAANAQLWDKAASLTGVNFLM